MEGAKKEIKKAIKKANYEKNKAELIQKAVERKKQKAMATKTRAKYQKTSKGWNRKGMTTVRKFCQKEADKDEKKKAQNRERSKRY